MGGHAALSGEAALRNAGSERGFTYLSGCWVPEVFDTQKNENERNEQRAEEKSADLVSGAGLLSRLGCFRLINERRGIGRGWLVVQGGMSTHVYRTFIMLSSCTVAKASYKLTSRKRRSSGLSRAVPPMVSAVCEDARLLRGGVRKALGCTCSGGKAGWLPPP